MVKVEKLYCSIESAVSILASASRGRVAKAEVAEKSGVGWKEEGECVRGRVRGEGKLEEEEIEDCRTTLTCSPRSLVKCAVA